VQRLVRRGMRLTSQEEGDGPIGAGLKALHLAQQANCTPRARALGKLTTA
jgi:hypothetical protein